jgi:hypothetical protein
MIARHSYGILKVASYRTFQNFSQWTLSAVVADITQEHFQTFLRLQVLRRRHNLQFVIYYYVSITVGGRGGAVVEALRFKSEGRGIDSRWCLWNFSLTSFRPHYGPGVHSASNRNEYQEYFLGVKAAGA